MPSIRVVYSQGSRHNGNIPEFTTKVNRRFDPKSSLHKSQKAVYTFFLKTILFWYVIPAYFWPK